MGSRTVEAILGDPVAATIRIRGAKPTDTALQTLSAVGRVVAALALTLPMSSWGANWLMLDATEPANAPVLAASAFASIEYQASRDTRLLAGGWSGQPDQFNRFAPRYADGSVFQIPGAGVGVHGRLRSGALTYRAALLGGENPTVQNDGGFVQLTDASVAWHSLPHARVRLGLFRQPLGDEAISPQQRYLYPSHVTQQMVQERYFRSDGSVNGSANLDLGPVSSFRDIGVQVFDAFRAQEWEHTYAVMLGRGTGVDPSMNRTGGERYVYWSSEWILSGEGPQRNGIKLYAWDQRGQRRLLAGAAQLPETFDRQRGGVGASLRSAGWSLAGEWISARGLVYHGPDGGAIPGSLSNNGALVAGYNVLPKSKARGWYGDVGYRVLPPLELQLRYDVLNRGSDSASTEIRFEALTLGGAWAVAPATRLLFGYQFRRYQAPRLDGASATNLLLEGVDDRIGVRLIQQFSL